MIKYIEWSTIPLGAKSVVARILLRTRKMTAHEIWRWAMNTWHPQAMDSRGKHGRGRP